MLHGLFWRSSFTVLCKIYIADMLSRWCRHKFMLCLLIFGFWFCIYTCHKPLWRPMIWIDMLVPWASYQIRKIAGCACAGNAGNVFPRRRFQRKLLVSYPGMHHGTCVTHVPWCMSGSLTCGDGENVPGIPGACAPAILRIWQEAHGAISPTVKGLIFKILWIFLLLYLCF